jgi:hypothetical protein
MALRNSSAWQWKGARLRTQSRSKKFHYFPKQYCYRSVFHNVVCQWRLTWDVFGMWLLEYWSGDTIQLVRAGDHQVSQSPLHHHPLCWHRDWVSIVQTWDITREEGSHLSSYFVQLSSIKSLLLCPGSYSLFHLFPLKMPKMWGLYQLWDQPPVLSSVGLNLFFNWVWMGFADSVSSEGPTVFGVN